MKAFKALETFIDFLCKIMTGIAAFMMAALTLDVFIQVIFRYFLQKPIAVSTELTAIFFPWIVCMAMIVVARREENTALMLFFEKFRGPVRHAAVIFINTVILLFFAVMAKSAFELSASLVNEILPLTRVSKAFTYGSMVIGFVGVCCMATFNLLKYILFEILKLDQKEA